MDYIGITALFVFTAIIGFQAFEFGKSVERRRTLRWIDRARTHHPDSETGLRALWYEIFNQTQAPEEHGD